MSNKIKDKTPRPADSSGDDKPKDGVIDTVLEMRAIPFFVEPKKSESDDDTANRRTHLDDAEVADFESGDDDTMRTDFDEDDQTDIHDHIDDD